jgi:hypothetical protein
MSNIEQLVRPVTAEAVVPKTTVVARPYFDTTFKAELRWGDQGQFTARQDQGGETMGVSEDPTATPSVPSGGTGGGSGTHDQQEPGKQTYSFNQRSEGGVPSARMDTVDAFCPRDSRKSIAIDVMVGGVFTGPARLHSGTDKEDDGKQLYDFSWTGELNGLFLRVVDAFWDEPVRLLGEAIFCDGYIIEFKAEDDKAVNLTSTELEKTQATDPRHRSSYWQRNSHHGIEANEGYVLKGKRIKVTLTRTAEAVIEELYSDGEWRAKGNKETPRAPKPIGSSSSTTNRAQIKAHASYPDIGLSWDIPFGPFDYVSSFSGVTVSKDNRSWEEATREAAFGRGPAPRPSGYRIETTSFSTSASEMLPESFDWWSAGAGWGTVTYSVMYDTPISTRERTAYEPNAGDKATKTGAVRMGSGEIKVDLYEDGELRADSTNVSIVDNPEKLLFARKIGTVVSLGIPEEEILPPRKPYAIKKSAWITV